MARIFPAGGGKQISWLDKVAEEQKPIGTAAIDLDVLKKLAGFGEEDAEEEVKSEEAETAKEGEAPPFAKEDKEVAEEKEDDDKEEKDDDKEEAPAAEAEAPAAEAPKAEAVEQAAEAVEKAKEALEEVSVALEDAGADVSDETAEVPVALEGDEITIPEEDSVVEVEIGADVAAPDMGVEPVADVAPEAEPFPAATVPAANPGANAPEASTSLMASSSRFYKVAELSPANKKKLKDYWVSSLGYDREYVDMMLKEYNPKASKKE